MEPQNDNCNDVTRIFINALSARQGGGQTYLINLLNYLPTNLGRLEISIAAPRALALPKQHQNVKRIPIFRLAENPFFRIFWEKLLLPSLLRRMKIDILFCPGGVVSTRPPSSCKTVTMFRNMIPFDLVQRGKYRYGYMRVRNWLLQKILLKSMMNADLVIFISEYAKGVIEKYARLSLKQSVIIPHGINPIFRQSGGLSIRLPWAIDGEYFLYVSILDVYKAQVEVIQAYAMLKRQRPTNEKLVLAGPENPDYGRKVRSEIKRLKLEDDVLLVGPIPYSELPAVYQKAKLNIFASECENCPNILLEALSAGRPLFSSNVPPMPEFGGNAPIYFDPQRPEELAGKIAKVIDNQKEIEDLSFRARKRSDQYQWSETAMRTWEAIIKLNTKTHGVR